MQVIRAQSAGFCLGVSLALRRLDAELERQTKGRTAPRQGEQGEGPKRLVTFGPIIHNPLVIRHYQERGVTCLDDPEGIGAGDCVVIRAHGIPREVEARLLASGASVADATCPKVKRAQLAIGREHAKGGLLLLFGERDHPEVQGLLSYAGHRAKVFGGLAELEALHLDSSSPYVLAAQTTQERTAFLQAREQLIARLGRDIPMLDTICDATRGRQEEVIALARRVRTIVVVGGLNSGNTRRLAEVARAEGARAIHVEQAGDISPDMAAATFAGCRVVGLTAGASTPEAHIAAMQAWLENYGNP